MPVDETAADPARQAQWRLRYAEALRCLGAAPGTADALARADALWLARVWPASTLPGPAPAGSPAAPPPAAPKARQDARPPPAEPRRRDGPADDAADRPPPGTTALFAAQPAFDGEERLAARRVLVAAADALPGRGALERALKPFLRRRPSVLRRALDAEATAEATAEASAQASAELLAHAGGRPPGVAVVPVLRPVGERWFDVVLLAERDEAMQAFEDTLLELRNLLARHGAFGQVRLWRWSVQGGEVAVQSPSGMACAPRAMLRAGSAQLVLVLTHGASPHWAGAPLRRFMQGLGAQAVLAIVQMLPPRAWGYTALGEAAERVRSRERGAPNRQLQRRDLWRGGFVDHQGLGAVPVLALEPGAVADWARFVMSPRLLEHAAAALDLAPATATPTAAPVTAPITPASPPPQAVAPGTAVPAAAVPDAAAVRAQVLRFRAVASPQAFALLRLLAASWITLPVMRLLLQSLPGPRSPAPLAEVLLSGLLVQVSRPGTPAQDQVFEFAAGVREWLLGSLSSDEQRLASEAMADSREAIRRFVESRTGVRLASFSALLRDPQGTEFLPASARAFVEVQRRLRALRGGDAGLAPADGPGAPASGTHGPRAAAPGALHNFPPVVLDLVDRHELEDHLLQRVLALEPGGTLVLRALPGVGARTLLARVLRRPEVLQRFGGGVWYGVEPPAAGEPDRPRLVLRWAEAKARRGDARIELRYGRRRPFDIGPLAESEAARHLAGLGLPTAQIDFLQAVHRGLPSLLPLAGVGAQLRLQRWPRVPAGQPESAFGALAERVLEALDAGTRDALLAMSVREPGFVAEATPAADLARRLGWLCPGAAGMADTLHRNVARWMAATYPQPVAAAHRQMVRDLQQGWSLPRLQAYAREHLLHHARAAGGSAAVRRVLMDRHMMEVLLQGGQQALARQIRPLAKADPAILQLLTRLELDIGSLPADEARRKLAPPWPWEGWPGLPSGPSRPTGEGVRVAVLGTGIDASHPELQHADIVGGGVDPNGHGTAIASIIAGLFIGIAPRVQLFSLAALDARGSGSTATMLKALEGLLGLPDAERPDILCLPLGMGQVDSPSHPLAHAMRLVDERGILVVAAAGNEGPGSFVFPAVMPQVLSVGALDGNGEPAHFSSRARVNWGGTPVREYPDLWAPGVDILVAGPLGEPEGGEATAKVRGRSTNGRNGYERESGSSHATAVVSALAALYAQVSGARGQDLRRLLVQGAAGRHAAFVPEVAMRHGGDDGRPSDGADRVATLDPRQAADAAAGLLRAVPGQDVVVLRIADGPELVLHPETARDLLRASEPGASR